jgi:hypothetical protein
MKIQGVVIGSVLLATSIMGSVQAGHHEEVTMVLPETVVDIAV